MNKMAELQAALNLTDREFAQLMMPSRDAAKAKNTVQQWKRTGTWSAQAEGLHNIIWLLMQMRNNKAEGADQALDRLMGLLIEDPQMFEMTREGHARAKKYLIKIGKLEEFEREASIDGFSLVYFANKEKEKETRGTK